MRAARLQGALQRLTVAIRDVESELAAMKAEHDPLAPPLSERQRHEERQAARDDRPGELQYCLRAWVSRQPRRMGTPYGCSCAAVNDPCRAVIRVDDAKGNVIETHEHKGDFKEP
jgi:hypothetical protein